MSLLIFRFWTARILISLKSGLKFLKDKALEIRVPQGSGKNNNTPYTAKCCMQRYQHWLCSVISISFDLKFY